MIIDINASYETASYVSKHRDVVAEFINKICQDINTRYGNSSNVNTKEVTDELRKRAYNHDLDKFRQYRNLELYAQSKGIETDEEKEEYKKLHKGGNRHHPEYYIYNKDEVMSYIDLIEFSADIFSSTLIRKNKIAEELHWERNTANFDKEVYEAILVTYAQYNYGFKQDLLSKYYGDTNILTKPNLVELGKDYILNNRKNKNYFNGKKGDK